MTKLTVHCCQCDINEACRSKNIVDFVVGEQQIKRNFRQWARREKLGFLSRRRKDKDIKTRQTDIKHLLHNRFFLERTLAETVGLINGGKMQNSCQFVPPNPTAVMARDNCRFGLYIAAV